MDNDLKQLARELISMPPELLEHAPAWLQQTVKEAKEELKKV